MMRGVPEAVADCQKNRARSMRAICCAEAPDSPDPWNDWCERQPGHDGPHVAFAPDGKSWTAWDGESVAVGAQL